MADVNRVPNVGGSPDSPKRKKGVESAAFRDMMKTGKVRETDPEEQRKRKRKQEAEEEAAASLTNQPPQTPSSKEEQPSSEETFRINVAPGATRRSLGGSYAPSEEEPEEQPYMPPSETPQDYPGYDYTQTLESTPAPQPQKPAQKKKSEPALPGTPVPPVKKQPPTPAPGRQKLPLTASKKPAPPIPRQPLAPLPSKSEKPSVAKPSLKKKKEEVPPNTLPLPQGAWEAQTASVRQEKSTKKVDTEKTKEDKEPPPAPPAPFFTSPLFTATPSTAPYVQLPTAVLEIFERMAGVMTVMQNSGVTQTSLLLDAPQFANSPFFGMEIQITEYSTAPKAFNIVFQGSPQALQPITENMEELVAAFQSGNYTFRVNRIETSLMQPLAEKRRRIVKPKRKSEK